MITTNRFMVVDDDSFNNLVCNHIIQKFNKDAQVILFIDPVKALTYIKDSFGVGTESSVTILFLDINMPVLNGWEFLEAFEAFGEKIHRQIQIFLLSSSIDQDDIKRAQQNPFVQGYYSKPLSLATLNLILQEQPTH